MLNIPIVVILNIVKMASSGEKKWNRPWSMDEMIENAENWSLAGDVVLLNTLKAYSEVYSLNF